MEFPKMLFPAGDVNQPYRIVDDAEAEQTAVDEGFRVAWSGTGESPKAVATPSPAPADTDATDATDAPPKTPKSTKRRGRPPKAA